MEKEELSLFESFRYRILTEIVHETRQNTPNFLLVVDKKSLSVVSGGVQVIDLTERGVTVIEMLEKPRMPLPEVDVLYFLSSTHKSVTKLLKDYSQSPFYRHVYLYFTSHVPDLLLKTIAESPIVSYIKVFKEANCNFRLLGSNSYSLETPGILKSLFLCKNSYERKDLISYLSHNLACLCGVMKDLPYVCYQSDSLPAQEIALALEDSINDLYRKVPNVPINTTRPIMIILDRNYDMNIPLVHDIHYEAILKDLYEVGIEGKVTYESIDNSNIASNKEAVINEFDEI